MSPKAKKSVTEDLIQEKRFAEFLMGQFFTDGINAKIVRPEVGMALIEYFEDSGTRFTGSQFEELLVASHSNRITERDLLAITTLNVNVPPRAALWILSDEGQRKTSELLQLIPDNRDI